MADAEAVGREVEGQALRVLGSILRTTLLLLLFPRANSSQCGIWTTPSKVGSKTLRPGVSVANLDKCPFFVRKHFLWTYRHLN
jgi:hypothetical protein